MKDIEISVILPTRDRPELLWDLIYNLHEKTSDYSKIEMIIGYDHDDEVTKNFLLSKNYKKDELAAKFGEELIDIKLIEFPFTGKTKFKGKINHHTHFDILGKEARASKWIWLTGDDFRILTNKWDDILRTHAPYGKRNNLSSYVAITPIITVDLYRIISDIWSPPIDQWLWTLKDKIQILHTMDKILDVEHRRWGAKKGQPGCSTLLQQFMKEEQWNNSLELAIKRFNEL